MDMGTVWYGIEVALSVGMNVMVGWFTMLLVVWYFAAPQPPLPLSRQVFFLCGVPCAAVVPSTRRLRVCSTPAELFLRPGVVWLARTSSVGEETMETMDRRITRYTVGCAGLLV